MSWIRWLPSLQDLSEESLWWPWKQHCLFTYIRLSVNFGYNTDSRVIKNKRSLGQFPKGMKPLILGEFFHIWKSRLVYLGNSSIFPFHNQLCSMHTFNWLRLHNSFKDLSSYHVVKLLQVMSQKITILEKYYKPAQGSTIQSSQLTGWNVGQRLPQPVKNSIESVLNNFTKSLLSSSPGKKFHRLKILNEIFLQ